MGAEDDLPVEVQAEVDKIRSDEGIVDDAPAAIEQIEVAPVEVERPKSRKQQAEEERAAQFRAVEERATKAEQLAQEIRNEANQRMARLEALLEAGQRYQQQPPVTEQQTERRDWRERADKAMRKAEKALAAGELTEYHDQLAKATELRMEGKFNPRLEETQQRFQQQIPQQPMQKPAWVTSVENEFPDVVQHAAGLNAVAAFINLDGSVGFSPEKLKRAFLRARQEITPDRAAPQPSERSRQLLSGAPTGGGGRGAPAAPNGSPKVSVPKNYREIAKSVGMTPDEYVRAAAAMERK
jgi:hypothetical protein